MKTIDLSNYKTSGSWVFSGRPKGEHVRKALILDTEDQSPDRVEVRVPDEIIALNRSFFLGLFGPSVRQLGEEAFRKKYAFHSSSLALRDIEAGIQRATVDGSALPVRG
jgi:hypothetical protein